MIGRKKGKIINIASICGETGVPEEATFSAAKAGVIIFTKALAKEVSPYGIDVNSISPGGIDTLITAQSRAKLQGTSKFKAGKPEDVAGVVTHLALDETTFISGQNYTISRVTSTF